MTAALLHGLLLATIAVSGAQSQGSCSAGQSCTPLRQCEDAVRLLREAEDTRDTARRLHIVTLLRGRVCGRRSERAVCCATDPEDTPRPQEAGAGSGLRRLGAFRNIFHDIGGTAYALDSRTILIKGFTYDGEGPDTFFLAGTSGRPSASGEFVLPWPADGRVYGYNDDIPLIKRSFDGSEDLTLQLPPGADVKDIKWLSVWCRAFNVNFGHVNLV